MPLKGNHFCNTPIYLTLFTILTFQNKWFKLNPNTYLNHCYSHVHQCLCRTEETGRSSSSLYSPYCPGGRSSSTWLCNQYIMSPKGIPCDGRRDEQKVLHNPEAWKPICEDCLNRYIHHIVCIINPCIIRTGFLSQKTVFISLYLLSASNQYSNIKYWI